MSASTNRPRPELVSDNSTATNAATVIGPLPIEVPAGEYVVRFSHYDTVYIFQPKLVLTFGIVDPETYAGTELSRWYNVRAIEEHRKRNGQFEVKARSLLVGDHLRLFGPITGASFSLDSWRGC